MDGAERMGMDTLTNRTLVADFIAFAALRNTGARALHFVVSFVKASANTVESPVKGSRKIPSSSSVAT